MTKKKPIISECQIGGGGRAATLPDSMIKLKILLSKLSEDIKTKILSKLPAKSLIRLKCMSKRWYSLIASDSHFTASHLRSQYDSSSSSSQLSLILVTNSTFSPNSTPSSRILLLRNDESDVVEIDTSYIMSRHHRRRRQSKLSIDDMTVCSNGLVCLFSRSYSKNNIILWNPTTRVFKNLPEPPEPPSGKGLICHVRMYSSFDPRNKDYKLVRMVQIADGLDKKNLDDDKVKKEQIVHVFSLRSNSWREVKRFSRFKSSFSSSGIELSGALYLIGSEKQGALSLKHGLLSFDLSDEEFKELDTPSAVCTKTEVKEIVKWKRKSLAVVIENLYTDEFECWSMKSDMSFSSKPLWTKRWAVRAPFFDSWRWLGVWRDRFLVVRTGNKRGREEEEMLAFDLPSGGERMILGKKVMDSSKVKAFDYVESLVSIEWIDRVPLEYSELKFGKSCTVPVNLKRVNEREICRVFYLQAGLMRRRTCPIVDPSFA